MWKPELFTTVFAWFTGGYHVHTKDFDPLINVHHAIVTPAQLKHHMALYTSNDKRMVRVGENKKKAV